MANHTLMARFAEACLLPARSINEWASVLCDGARPLFERGGAQGAVALINRRGREGITGSREVIAAGTGCVNPLFELGPDIVFDGVGPAMGRAVMQPFRISYASHLYGRSSMRGLEPWDRFFRKVGYIDQLGIDFSSDGYGVLSTMIRDRGWAKERVRDLRTMRRLLVRSAPARFRCLDVDDADAVIAPDGRILHAPDGLGRDTGSVLATAVRVMERARVDARTAEEGERIWDELLAGRWSVIEHIDTDGKRVLLLTRAAGPKSALSPEETALLDRVRSGASMKQIASELGLSTAATSERVKAALVKLGFSSRADYLRHSNHQL